MYTIKEAAARSGVGIPLLRAWERRYRVVEPTRTPSGYRLYDEAAIARLREMRLLIERGWTASQAAEKVRHADPDSFEDAPAAAPFTAGDRAGAQHADALVRAATRIDPDAIEESLDAAFCAGSFETVMDGIVLPALRRIGEEWSTGELGVAGEHAASLAVLRRLAMAYAAAASTSGQRPVLVGLPPGGRHELGALAFATTARRLRIPVLYLGPDLPVDEWVRAAGERGASAVVLAVPMREDVAPAVEVLTVTHDELPALPRAVGGAFAPDVALQTGAAHLAGPLSEAAASLRQLIRSTLRAG